MKFPIGKHGLKCDPRHAHVTLEYKGRTLLGEVISVRRDELCGCYRLTVKHFCGDMWPLEPSLLAVDVLERTYEDAA